MKVVFLDVDGCLSPGKYQRFDLAGLQHLEQLAQRAHDTEVVLCTGRSHSYLEALSQVVRLGRYAVTDHGATVFDYVADEVVFAPQVTAEILAQLNELERFFMVRENEFVTHWKICHGKRASLSLAAEEGKDAFAVREVVAPFCSPEHFQLLCSGRALDIVPQGINKWTGAQFFLANWQRSPSEIVAIGDSLGDMPILTKVDFAACPANAAPEVQAVCHYISPEREIWGVCDIFARYLL